MPDPLVSIVTPSYNQGRFIRQTIESVLNQSYSNIEYIIIDGGSNDNSVDIIREYDSKLKFWISEQDSGQADAINKGIRRCSGVYFCWLNSDDILYPDFIKERVSQFQKSPDIDMIYGDVHQGRHPENKILRKGKQTTFLEMLVSTKVPIPQQSAVWKKMIFDVAGLLDTRWNVLLDRDLFMRIAFSGKILYIPGSAGFFRNHPDSKSVSLSLDWIEEIQAYYHFLFNEFLDPSFHKFKKKSYAHMFEWCAKIAYQNQKFKSYLKYAIHAMGYDLPTGLGSVKYLFSNRK